MRKECLYCGRDTEKDGRWARCPACGLTIRFGWDDVTNRDGMWVWVVNDEVEVMSGWEMVPEGCLYVAERRDG